MALSGKYPMTKKGEEKLKQEIAFLKSEKRKEIAERVKKARSFCDFSEDPEYVAVVEERMSLEERIKSLEYIARHIKIVEEKEDGDTVALGKTVTYVELPDGDEETYTIVGTLEADPFEGKISDESPIAKSLLGKKANDEVLIQTPAGKRKVKIVKVH